MKANDGNGPVGEQELLANAGLRINGVLKDRDDVGDDLNLIVGLLLSILRFPSSASQLAVSTYAKNRLVSYGSFVDTYLQDYRTNILNFAALDTQTRQRLDDGIDNRHWTTDSSRVYGAVRWYHRAGSGANPELAEIYRPIIAAYLE